MRLPKEVKELLDKVPPLLLGLANEAVTLSEELTKISTELQETLDCSVVEDE